MATTSTSTVSGRSGQHRKHARSSEVHKTVAIAAALAAGIVVAGGITGGAIGSDQTSGNATGTTSPTTSPTMFDAPTLTASGSPMPARRDATLAPLAVLGLIPPGAPSATPVGKPSAAGGFGDDAAPAAVRLAGGGATLRVVGPNFVGPTVTGFRSATVGGGRGSDPAAPITFAAPSVSAMAAVMAVPGGQAFLGLIGPGGLLIGDGLDGAPGQAGGNGGLLWGNGGKGGDGFAFGTGGNGGNGGLFFGSGGAGGNGGAGGGGGGNGGNAGLLLGNGGVGGNAGAAGSNMTGENGVNPTPNGTTAESEVTVWASGNPAATVRMVASIKPGAQEVTAAPAPLSMALPLRVTAVTAAEAAMVLPAVRA
jgi:hypothetical protein